MKTAPVAMPRAIYADIIYFLYTYVCMKRAPVAMPRTLAVSTI